MMVVLVMLIVLSFLLSGSEAAFFSLTGKDINILKTRERPSFKRILLLTESPKTLQSSILIANTLVNLGIIIIGNILLSQYFGALGIKSFLVKMISLALLLVVFVEILPKVWANHHKIWFAANSSLVVEIFHTLFFRLSKRMARINENLEQKIAANNSGAEPSIEDAIDLLPEDEATPEEKEMLKGIRKFGDTEVKQIMRTRMDVNGIPFETNFEELKKLVSELHYSRIPVYRGSLDDIAGMLHTKDLLPVLNESADYDWHGLLRTPYFVHEKKYIEDLLQEFRNKRIHFAVVVDEFGGTSGIVTLEDIVEEVVGDIRDEFDDDESSNTRIDDYNYVFEGKTMVTDVCKAMNLPLDTFDDVRGESDSIGGMLLEIAGEFPQAEQQFFVKDFILMPLSIANHRIDKVRITIQRTGQI